MVYDIVKNEKFFEVFCFLELFKDFEFISVKLNEVEKAGLSSKRPRKKIQFKLEDEFFSRRGE